MAEWEKLPPHKDPHIGCETCGGGEMVEDQTHKIVADMNTILYNGFGGWYITKDGKHFYQGEQDKGFDEYPMLHVFETLARNDPNHDWRAECILPLREATYQRQGKNEWVLIASGPGFA